MFTYKIKNKTVEIYAPGSKVPFILQPAYPSGEGWTVSEATAWAGLFVKVKNDPTAEELPGESKAKPVKYRSELPVLPEPDLTIPGLEEAAAEEAPAEEAPAEEAPKTTAKKK
jgi:hypothetical protein